VSYLNSPPLPSPLSSLPQFLGIVSTGIIFCIYIHVYSVFAWYSPSYPLSPLCPHTLVPAFSPGQDLFCPSVLWFCRRKKRIDERKIWYFSLFEVKVAAQLWYFHVCMYYNPNWFIGSLFCTRAVLLSFHRTL
jgi:hypothetical protein